MFENNWIYKKIPMSVIKATVRIARIKGWRDEVYKMKDYIIIKVNI
jgi:hypothetical protein